MEKNFSKAVEQFIGSQKGLDNDINEFTNNNCKFPEDAIEVSIKRACVDMTARTLNVKKGDKKGGEYFDNAVINKIGVRIKDYFKLESDDYKNEKFDQWHQATCECLIPVINDHYKMKNGADIKYGKAQKIVNMTFKYLFCYAYKDENIYNQYKNHFENCHVPLDNYVLKAMLNRKGLKKDEQLNGWINCIKKDSDNHYKICYKKENDDQYFLIEVPKRICAKKGECRTAWSNIESYDLYFKIQDMLRQNIPECFSPLEWEIKVWSDEK